jgi:hypothetical protein
LRQTLAPALTLRHLLDHGARIAGRTQQRRPARPLQMIGLLKINQSP